MVVYTISQHEIDYPTNTVPEVLSGVFSERDYSYICQRFKGVESEAYCFGLVITLALTICITPIALFFCPCFVSYRITSEKKRIANEINLQMFRGFHVIEAHEFNGILIHTDRIPDFIPAAAVPVQAVTQTQPIMVSSDYVHVESSTGKLESTEASAHSVGYVNSPMQSTVQCELVPVQPVLPPRTMAVPIPNNLSPGQQLRIQTPLGDYLDMTIPAGVQPGSTILVPY